MPDAPSPWERESLAYQSSSTVRCPRCQDLEAQIATLAQERDEARRVAESLAQRCAEKATMSVEVADTLLPGLLEIETDTE